jgi:hypothetical protein
MKLLTQRRVLESEQPAGINVDKAIILSPEASTRLVDGLEKANQVRALLGG